MDNTAVQVTMQDIISQIETLPQEYFMDVYKYVSEIKKSNTKPIRAWCEKDSLMKTKPIHIENFVWNREDCYDK